MAEKTEKTEKPVEKTGEKTEKKQAAPKAAGGKRNKEVKVEVAIAKEGETKVTPALAPRLQKKYHDEVAPALMKKFSFKSAMQVPRIEKVVLNCSIKEAVANPKVVDHCMNDMMRISGQRPVITRAKKAIATFKLREGMPIGVAVTLRRARMYEFLDRLMNVALPRVRDFKGVGTKSFDGRGNYSLGLREQIIFPEIDYDKVDGIRGLTVTIVTSAKKNEHARALLAELGMPFKK